ncbi:hypothetical protein ACHQM5_013612 [Ranunculus cassubicifolius]
MAAESSSSTLPANSKLSLLNSIDLSSSDAQTSVSLLKQACLDSGFFYVVNHGISSEFMEEVFEQSKMFFELPIDEKMKLLRNEKHRGYTPVLDEHLDPKNQVNDILPRWRETMEKYHGEALRVAKEVAKIIALALGLDEDFFDKPEMLVEPIATLRLLHYEGTVSDTEKGIYGAGAHSDFGFITLLATDDVWGLQICKDKDANPQVWEYVPPQKGAFIINLGDLLERWSNGIFRSTVHRVLGCTQERYSIAYFVDPNQDCLVECLPSCKSETNPPKFPPVKCSTYLRQRYKDTHTDLSSYQNRKT